MRAIVIGSGIGGGGIVPIEPGGSTFCKHEIEVGTPVGTQVPVLAGLAPGELVVVAGTFRLKAEHGKSSAQHEH